MQSQADGRFDFDTKCNRIETTLSQKIIMGCVFVQSRVEGRFDFGHTVLVAVGRGVIRMHAQVHAWCVESQMGVGSILRTGKRSLWTMECMRVVGGGARRRRVF